MKLVYVVKWVLGNGTQKQPAEQEIMTMTQETAGQPVKKGKGCFFYGCLIAVIIVALTAAGLFYGYWKIKQTLMAYTDTESIRIEAVRVTDEQVQSYRARVEAFLEKAQEGKEPAQLVLTADEINALIQNSEQFKEFKGKVQISFANDKATGKVSLPLEDLDPVLKGKYVNGEATFNVSCENGVLLVTLQALTVKGKPLPEMFLEGLRQENLAKDLYKDPETAETMRRIKTIRIQGGRLIVETVPAPAGSAAPASAVPAVEPPANP